MKMIKYITREGRVNEFFAAAGKTPYNGESWDDSVLSCVEEETGEFIRAAYEYEEAVNEVDIDKSREARKNLVKEWADLQYVVSQAAIYFDIPAEAAFDCIHENNMTKVVDGKVIRREDGKILKPEGYVPADTTNL